jgi:hypothetical protein
MPSNLTGIIYPIPNVDIGWGVTLNNNTTIIDNVFAAGGTGTSVGLQVGSTKILGIGGTLLLGSGDNTGTVIAPTIRGAARTGSNVVGANLTIDAANGTGTGGSGALIFRTFPPGAGGVTPNSPQNSLVIDSAGNVGIGTSSPGAYGKVEVVGALYPAIAARSTDASGVAFSMTAVSSTEGRLNVLTANPMTFYTNNTERLRIGASGQIGIGGANYGTTNQVLTSNGSGSAPSWNNPAIGSLGPQTFAAGSGGNLFTGIPAWAKSITMTVSSMDSTADVLVRVGPSAGIVSSGYSSSGTIIGASSNTSSTANDITGFLINIGGSTGSGTIRLTYVNGFTWACDHVIGTTTTKTCMGGGTVTLAAALDRVQIIPATGTFAATGTVTVMYQ